MIVMIMIVMPRLWQITNSYARLNPLSLSTPHPLHRIHPWPNVDRWSHAINAHTTGSDYISWDTNNFVCILQCLLHFVWLRVKYSPCQIHNRFPSQILVSLLGWKVSNDTYEFLVLLTYQFLCFIKKRGNNKSVSWGHENVWNGSHRCLFLNLVRDILNSYVCSQSTAILQDNFVFRYKWSPVSGKTCSWREQSKWSKSRKETLV